MTTPEEAAISYREVVATYSVRAARRRTQEERNSGFRIAFDRCESPIEQAFCLSLFQLPDVYAIKGDFRPQLADHRPKKRGVLVFAQNPIKRYRADFLLVALSPLKAEPAFLIVECDGEAYHSAEEDVLRDEARERELRATGFRIVRHTGREIFRDPVEVVNRTMSALSTHGWNKYEGYMINTATLCRALHELMPLPLKEMNPRMGAIKETSVHVFDAVGSSIDGCYNEYMHR